MIARADGDFSSYWDFCGRIESQEVGKQARENLAKAGTFDRLESRQELLEKYWDATDLEMMIMEKETLGVCLSGDLLDEFWYDNGAIHINELAEVDSEPWFMTIGIVDTDVLEVVIFSSVYDCPLEVGDIIHLEGRLDQDQREPHEPPKAIAIDYDLLRTRDPV